ncbi:MAG: pyroglutamyl-peptidase I [Bacteroidia bacterium]|nr:pyroglutamyl-peptidase I [Bacteroidia bacterium]
MRILLTAFEPFGGSDRNPTIEIVRSIRESMPWIHTAVLPVVTGVSAGSAWAALQPMLDEPWDAVVHLGESAKATAIMVERVAVNLRDSGVADNTGSMLRDAPVIDGGPAAYFATLPVRELVSASLMIDVPAALSLSAGTFLCNETMYRTLHAMHAVRRSTLAGFVHVPQLPEQAAVRGGPSMDAVVMARAVEAMLSRLHEGPRLAQA